MSRIAIHSSDFSHEEIHKIVNTVKEWEQEHLVKIDYVVMDGESTVTATFSLEEEDLGEFIHLMYGCGWNGALGQYDLEPRPGY